MEFRPCLGALYVCSILALGAAPSSAESRPHILLVSIDTLRAQNLGAYGYERNTSPYLDRLFAGGVRFDNARTVTSLTAPALASMLTSLHPHEHGSTRNGLRVRPNLFSFTKSLGRSGYATGAFVGNWTLKDKLSGLAEHFDSYEVLLTRKRWLGLVRGEATADDLVDVSLSWLDDHLEAGDRPFLIWVHMIEPHAPYRLRADYLEQIGVKRAGSVLSARKRYDSEVAYSDARVGRLLDEVFERVPREEVLVVFLADHGESLGEHGYWGHGRHLYEVTLRIPLAFSWPGTIESGVVAAPASIRDLAPTLLSLAGVEPPEFVGGFDWSGVLLRGEPAPAGRVTLHQAHKSAVGPQEEQTRLRARGLLEVGRVAEGRKEIYRVTNARLRVFELEDDPWETGSVSPQDAAPSAELQTWLDLVRRGLVVADDLPPPNLSDEDLDALRALGYLD